MDKIEVLSSTVDFTSARYEDLVLQIWHKDTTLEGVSAFRSCVDGVARDHRERARVLIVVEPRASMPPREARSAIAAVMMDHRENIRASGLAFEGTGFGAASIRAVVTGLNLLTHHPFPYRVFPSIPEALSWAPLASSSGIPAMTAARVIRTFRSERSLLCIAS